MVISLGLRGLGPMNPAAPIPPIVTVRLPPGAEVGSGIYNYRAVSSWVCCALSGPGDSYALGVPAPGLSGSGAWQVPLRQTDGSLNTQPQYGALTVSCLNGCLPPTERAAACSGPGGSLVPDDPPPGGLEGA